MKTVLKLVRMDPRQDVPGGRSPAAWSRCAAVLMLLLLSVISGCHDVRMHRVEIPKVKAKPMRVLSFNIRYDNPDDGPNRWEARKDLVFGVLRQHQPSVIGMQEVLYNQLRDLEAALPDYDWVGAGRDNGLIQGEFSPIFYHRNEFELLAYQTFWLSTKETKFEPGSVHPNADLPRICTWAHLRSRETGREVFIFNTHWSHMSAAARQFSAEQVVSTAAETLRKHRNSWVVITGDFNAGPTTKEVMTIAQYPHVPGADWSLAPMPDTPVSPCFEDSYRQVHGPGKPEGTFNGWKGRTTGERIDYVWVSGAVDIADAGIIYDHTNGRYPSDHFPIFADLKPAE